MLEALDSVRFRKLIGLMHTGVRPAIHPAADDSPESVDSA